MNYNLRTWFLSHLQFTVLYFLQNLSAASNTPELSPGVQNMLSPHSTPHRHSTTHLSHELVNLCLYGCKLDDPRRIFNKNLWICKLLNLIYALTCEFVVCHDIYIYILHVFVVIYDQ